MAEMKRHHQEILLQERRYLLHNITPTEELWAALIERDILAPIMIEEIKAYRTPSERICRMLDLLPARGPHAFEDLCEILLECSHSFVAEKLMRLDGIEKLRAACNKEYQNSNNSLGERFLRDKIPDLYKMTTIPVKRFFERKIELEIRKQEDDFLTLKEEIDDKNDDLERREKECYSLRYLLKKMTERTRSVASEISHEYVSRSQLNEEKKILENLTFTAASNSDYENEFNQWKTDMLSMINSLEEWANIRIRGHLKSMVSSQEEHYDKNTGLRVSTKKKLLHVMEVLENMMGPVLRDDSNTMTELHEGLKLCQQISNDLQHAGRKYKDVSHRYKELNQEVLSLINSHFMIRNNEEELKEKRKHINSVKSQSNVMKRKSNKHSRQLEMLQKTLNEHKSHATDLEEQIKRRLDSADDRIRFIFDLVPDDDDDRHQSPMLNDSRQPSDLATDTNVDDIDCNPDLQSEHEENEASEIVPMKSTHRNNTSNAQYRTNASASDKVNFKCNTERSHKPQDMKGNHRGNSTDDSRKKIGLAKSNSIDTKKCDDMVDLSNGIPGKTSNEECNAYKGPKTCTSSMSGKTNANESRQISQATADGSKVKDTSNKTVKRLVSFYNERNIPATNSNRRLSISTMEFEGSHQDQVSTNMKPSEVPFSNSGQQNRSRKKPRTDPRDTESTYYNNTDSESSDHSIDVLSKCEQSDKLRMTKNTKMLPRNIGSNSCSGTTPRVLRRRFSSRTTRVEEKPPRQALNASKVTL